MCFLLFITSRTHLKQWVAKPSLFSICNPDGYGFLLKGEYSASSLVWSFGPTEQVDGAWTNHFYRGNRNGLRRDQITPPRDSCKRVHPWHRSLELTVPSLFSSINLFFISIAFSAMIRPEAQSKSVVRNIRQRIKHINTITYASTVVCVPLVGLGYHHKML